MAKKKQNPSANKNNLGAVIAITAGGLLWYKYANSEEPVEQYLEEYAEDEQQEYIEEQEYDMQGELPEEE